jgi:hypothetical protein
MKRVLGLVLALTVAFGGLAGAGCARTVTVRTGTHYVCTYGEVIGDDVRQLQVPAADAAKYTVVTKVVTCARHRAAEAFYASAQAAIRSGDLKTALADLTKSINLDSSFRQAPKQMTEIRAGKKPTPDGSAPTPGSSPKTPSPSTPGTSGAPDAPQPLGPMDNYRALLPDQIPGFKAEALKVEDLSLSRDYVPADTGRYDQLVVMVEQYSSSGAARRAMAGEIQSAYPSYAADVTVSGLKGYFGANGSGFAVVSLDKGGLLVTLELHATGAKPADLRTVLESIARQVLG